MTTTVSLSLWLFTVLLFIVAYTLSESNLVWQFSLIKTWALVPALNREQDLNSKTYNLKNEKVNTI